MCSARHYVNILPRLMAALTFSRIRGFEDAPSAACIAFQTFQDTVNGSFGDAHLVIYALLCKRGGICSSTPSSALPPSLETFRRSCLVLRFHLLGAQEKPVDERKQVEESPVPLGKARLYPRDLLSLVGPPGSVHVGPREAK